MPPLHALIQCAPQSPLRSQSTRRQLSPPRPEVSPAPRPGPCTDRRGSQPTSARRRREVVSPNAAHTRERSNVGPRGNAAWVAGKASELTGRPAGPGVRGGGRRARPRPHQAAEWPYAASRLGPRAKPERKELSLPGRVPAAPSSLRLRPTFCSASGPPRSGSGPASPGSFKLTSDRYRGMGAAERLPSTSERDTETPEVERPAREPDEKARERPEIPAVNRRRRRPLPEIVEAHRKLPSLTQRIGSSSRPRLYSRTPRPIGHPRLGHGQTAVTGLGEGCLSRRGALRGLAAFAIRPAAFLY